jgi:hypothetical protein
VAVLVLCPVFADLQLPLPFRALLPTSYYLRAALGSLSLRPTLYYLGALLLLWSLCSRLRAWFLARLSAKD